MDLGLPGALGNVDDLVELQVVLLLLGLLSHETGVLWLSVIRLHLAPLLLQLGVLKESERSGKAELPTAL